MMAQPVGEKQILSKKPEQDILLRISKPVPVSVVAGAGCFISRKGNEKDRPYRSRQPSAAMRFIFTSGLFQDSSLCS